MKAPAGLAKFDSASAMVQALAARLHGRDFAGLAIIPEVFAPVGRLINTLPAFVREEIYTWSGWWEAISADKLKHFSAEDVSRWFTEPYPRRKYPAVAIGSSSGAMTHLWAALGIPWLPQTFLVVIGRHGVDPDDPRAEMQWGIEPGRAFLEANPDLQLHHMQDPCQDRLMVRHMAYFRPKRLRLGPVYEQFLRDCLAPGGTIYVAECELSWPTVQVEERHFFQHGGLGATRPQEYFHGGPRVAEYLRRYGIRRRKWDPPLPDAIRPEAEWGFEPALREDVIRFARRHGYRVCRVTFSDPETPSPFVADLYRSWQAQRGLPSRRLLIESFILFEPAWCLATGTVPFWMSINAEPSAVRVESYLREAEAYDDIYIMVFSNGVESIGTVPIAQWKKVLRHARRRGQFVGIDPRAYPRDFGSFFRYHAELTHKVPVQGSLPRPLTVAEFEVYLQRQAAPPAIAFAAVTASSNSLEEPRRAAYASTLAG